MPKGWFCFSRKTSRVSATPSPSVSRHSVMRLALTPVARARRSVACIAWSIRRLGVSTCISASATSTSPFGSTSIQRGCIEVRGKGIDLQARSGRGNFPRRPTFGGWHFQGHDSLFFRVRDRRLQYLRPLCPGRPLRRSATIAAPTIWRCSCDNIHVLPRCFCWSNGIVGPEPVQARNLLLGNRQIHSHPKAAMLKINRTAALCARRPFGTPRRSA